MERQRKIAAALTLIVILITVDFGPNWPTAAAEPGKSENEIRLEFEKTLDRLRRGTAKTRPDWMITATAKTGRWDFSVVYTKDKNLLLPVLNNSNSTTTSPVPPLTDLVLPQNASVGLYVTSNDDIHPLVVPGLSIKAEALPGRLEQVAIDTARLGVFPTACVAPCGPRDKTMTFNVHIVDTMTFKYWLAARYAADEAQTKR